MKPQQELTNKLLSKLVNGIDSIALSLKHLLIKIDNSNKTKNIDNSGFNIKTNISFRESTLWQWILSDNSNYSVLKPIDNHGYLPLSLLIGCDSQAEKLIKNIQHFAENKTANHVLLWGSRGSGKSSIVMACIAEIMDKSKNKIKVIEICRNSIQHMASLWSILVSDSSKCKFILLCDDLTFENSNSDYKSFKTLIDGAINSRTNKILLLATSNRRHLMPRHIMENESIYDIHGNESIDEKVSLSDRFGLWLGFHAVNQEQYLNIISKYMDWGMIQQNDWHESSLIWAKIRGSRSGRVAWQFFVDYCANNNINVPDLPKLAKY